MRRTISCSAAGSNSTPTALTGSASALAASTSESGPMFGKLKSRSAYDFDSPARAGRIGRPAPIRTSGRPRCCILCIAMISALNSDWSKYWISSISRATGIPRSLAASASAVKTSGISTSRSPLSADPRSGSMSSPSSISATVTFKPPTKLLSTPSARRTLSPAPATRSSWSRSRRRWGTSSAARDLPSCASRRIVR